MKSVNKNEIIRGRLKKAHSSPLKTYIEFTVGDASFFYFLKYEITTFFLGALPGAIGLLLRRIFYKKLFGKVGKGLILGKSVVIRHPHKIQIGDNVTIDDYCLIDARGVGEKMLILEDDVIINRNCMLQAKAGPIRLGRRTCIGSYSSITSLENVEFGEAVLTGGGCYFSSGAYIFDDTDVPVMDQETYSKGQIIIGAKSYFGAYSRVVGGIRVGESAVIGAASVVLHDVPRGAIVAGVPSKILSIRKVND